MDDYQLALLYVSIVSFQFHPGVEVRLTPKECLAEAFRYAVEFDQVRGSVRRSVPREPSEAG